MGATMVLPVLRVRNEPLQPVFLLRATHHGALEAGRRE